MTLVEQLFGAGKTLKTITAEELLEYNRQTTQAYREKLSPEKKRVLLAQRRVREQAAYARNPEKTLILMKKTAWRRTHPEVRIKSSRAWRKSHPEWVKKQYQIWKEKTPVEIKEAKLAYRRAIRKGLLVMPETCERCQKRKARLGHHEDYSKPLQVTWLCNPCHRAVHGVTKYTDEELGING